MPKYLQSQLKLVTTQCIIVEAEQLGPQLVGASQIVKQFLVHRCGHDKSSINGSACILSMVCTFQVKRIHLQNHKNINSTIFLYDGKQVKNNNYIVATQDREIQNFLRLKPGQPLMYLHNRTPVFEIPSDASKTFVQNKLNKSLSFDGRDETKLNVLRKIEGIPAPIKIDQKVKKKFKIKQPNPLSCKKKKKKVDINQSGITKNVRKRLKNCKYIKETLKE